MTDLPTTDFVPSNGLFVDSSHSAQLESQETRIESVIAAKPPLSPVSIHQSQRTTGSSTLPRPPQYNQPIGAVASLAISGGISQEELLRFGQNRPPPVSIRSTRAAAITTRVSGFRGGPRRGHHTAPPGTVQIGRVTRVTRCDICLSPPSSTFCSFHPSPRSSPLHLTRVGGIATVSNDRKSSLPGLPTDQLVRIGPGNVVSTKGQNYARINCYPQPYKSASVDTIAESVSPPNAVKNGRTSLGSPISSRVSVLSDTTENVGRNSAHFPVSPGGHSTSSADAVSRNANMSSCPIASNSEEAVHFFGSSFTSGQGDATTTGGSDTTTTAADALARNSPARLRNQQHMDYSTSRDMHQQINEHITIRVLGGLGTPGQARRGTLTRSLTTGNSIEKNKDDILLVVMESEAIQSATLICVFICLSSFLSFRVDSYQQRLYHQHIARSFRNLRRYRHIYGDSVRKIYLAPSSEERENPSASASSIQHRRSSADEALIVREESEKQAPSPSSPPPPSPPRHKISNVEQRRRRRHLFISHRNAHHHSESQRRIEEAVPVATVIVALETDGNTFQKPPKFLWLHRRCFVYNGYIFLISLTESVASTIASKITVSCIHGKSSTSPPSLCEGTWCQALANCELTWSDVGDTDLHSITNCGLLQSSQVYPLSCTLRVPNHAEKDNLSDYTYRVYFLQQDQRLERVIAELKGDVVSPPLL
ncbi:unnamed protein product [Rodentolepis nana]|uniref:RING-type domain-containing protein n=1 Tax=Rodentolepis nana TaxID=102285 RepID=A0A158QHJ7_RODNA|nr:unnamed protein product [Rodentolepis nana]